MFSETSVLKVNLIVNLWLHLWTVFRINNRTSLTYTIIPFLYITTRTSKTKFHNSFIWNWNILKHKIYFSFWSSENYFLLFKYREYNFRKIKFYLITVRFPKNSQSTVSYRRPSLYLITAPYTLIKYLYANTYIPS